ncbi:MAG: hypothetical protein L3J71_12510 [Victivallaceae bacterium]|nr:hypothetical protein [Victivallaceae bacterium]
MIKLFALMVNCVLLVAQVTAAECYIDSSAPDGGDGSVANPYNEISDLNIASIQAGDKINLKRGSIFRERLP